MSDKDTAESTLVVPAVPVAPAVPIVPSTPTVADIGKYEAEKADRQLKHWVIKVIVSVVALMFSVACSAFIYMSVVKGPNSGADASVIKTFLDTLLEMFKIMKTS